MKQVVKDGTNRPIKIWTNDIDDSALTQAKNLASLPFIASNGVALMPDVHAGIGSTVGSVIATSKAVIPAAVGVDIGCGMNAVRLSLKASDLPDSLAAVRSRIEEHIPLGAGGSHKMQAMLDANNAVVRGLLFGRPIVDVLTRVTPHFDTKATQQLGSLGSGNHFIEVCIDESEDIWIMLHSGSRGIGNMIGRHFIELAKRDMERYYINLPDKDLAYLPEGSEHYDDYLNAVDWAQDYALENRKMMMRMVIAAMRHTIDKPFTLTSEAVNCHHNYIARENHFGENLWITRKGAIRAREGDLGIIPGSMGQRSYIVCGKGHAESYCSCSHGAGRRMSRTEARRKFTTDDLAAQTRGVECRKDAAVLDEIPESYKDIDEVMANQSDLVEIVHTLKQVLCVKGA